LASLVVMIAILKSEVATQWANHFRGTSVAHVVLKK